LAKNGSLGVTKIGFGFQALANKKRKGANITNYRRCNEILAFVSKYKNSGKS
jgi:hypothetical protein|tara:strand:- start:1026 stop:1181 length:156 start_codon:yes stop_codon:yes gene_type:complete